VIKPILALSGEKWKSVVTRSRGSDLVLTGAANVRDRVHQEHGVTFLSASRFGIEHETDKEKGSF
jgi:hypothetical protein